MGEKSRYPAFFIPTDLFAEIFSHNDCFFTSQERLVNWCSIELSERISQKVVNRGSLTGLLIYLRTLPSSSQAEHRSRSYMCPCDAHGFFSLASESKKNSHVKSPTASIWRKLVDKFLSSSSTAMSTIIQQFLVHIFQ